MTLNEDYFKDIEIADDVIDTIHGDDDMNDIYDNPKDYFEKMQSEYTSRLYIKVCSRNSIKYVTKLPEIWDVYVPYILKKLLFLFNAYGVEYSEPIIQDIKPFEETIYKTMGSFFDFHNLKFRTKSKNATLPKHGLHEVYVVINLRLPRFNSYERACMFNLNLMRSIWGNKEYSRYFAYIILSHQKVVDNMILNTGLLNELGIRTYELRIYYLA